MSLQASVQRLRNQEADRAAIRQDPQAFISQWRTDVGTVYRWFEGALRPFITDGSAQLAREATTVKEDELGEYEIDFLVILVLGRRILLTPHGRLVSGGTGRMDLYKESRPSEDNRILLLRSPADLDYAPGVWGIQECPKPLTPMGMAFMQPQSILERSKRKYHHLDEKQEGRIQDSVDFVLNA